jgi:hypothetical protein
MAGQYEMRIGDAEREATVNELREHFASGRLTQEEFNQRVDQAFAAKTRGDLKAVMRDLPSARPLVTTTPSGSSGGGQSRGARPAGAFIAAMAALWALILAFSVLDFGFGFGGTRPLAVVLFFAALAMLRRLVFGRRRGWAGPRGGRCGRRRW